MRNVLKQLFNPHHEDELNSYLEKSKMKTLRLKDPKE